MGTRSARAGEVRSGAQAEWGLSSPAPSPSLSESPGESRPEAASHWCGAGGSRSCFNAWPTAPATRGRRSPASTSNLLRPAVAGVKRPILRQQKVPQNAGRVTAGGGEPLVRSMGVNKLLQRVVHRAGHRRQHREAADQLNLPLEYPWWPAVAGAKRPTVRQQAARPGRVEDGGVRKYARALVHGANLQHCRMWRHLGQHATSCLEDIIVHSCRRRERL